MLWIWRDLDKIGNEADYKQKAYENWIVLHAYVIMGEHEDH